MEAQIILPVQKEDKANKVHKRQSLSTPSQKVGDIKKTRQTIKSVDQKQMENSRAVQADIPCTLWKEEM